MLSASKLIAVTFSLLSASSAAPLIAPGACKPNFQGANLGISNQGFPAWTSPNPAYHIQGSGQYPDSFLIRLVTPDNQDTVVAATAQTPGSGLTIVPVNHNSADPLQIWDVRCDVCGDPKQGIKFTTGCGFSLRAAPNSCIAVLADLSLQLATCDGTAGQKFDFQGLP